MSAVPVPPRSAVAPEHTRELASIFATEEAWEAADQQVTDRLPALTASRSLCARTAAAASFAEPELIGVGSETLRRWADQEPRLALYGHSCDRLVRRAPHVRAPVEVFHNLIATFRP